MPKCRVPRVRPELEMRVRSRLSNAAVKRREARRPTSLAGGPSAEGPAASQDRPDLGAAFRTGALRRFTSPHARNEGAWDDKANPAPFQEHGR